MMAGDQVSGAIVDRALATDPTVRLAAESAVARGVVFVAVRSMSDLDVGGAARGVIDWVGDRDGPFQARDCNVVASLATATPVGACRVARMAAGPTHGCIRLYAPDIERLFERAAVGTPVLTVDQPLKAGWRGEVLYLEAHPTQTQADALEAGEPVPSLTHDDLSERVAAASRSRMAN